MQTISVTIAILGFMGLANSKLAPTIQLNNGYDIPVIGLGTYTAVSDDCERAVKDAIDIGYRHIDTAFLYGNEAEVGKAIRAKINEGVIKREDIFVTTKLWSTFHEPDQVEKAFQRSFDNLNLGYIDLYLIHNPMAFRRVLQNPQLPNNDVNSFQMLPTSESGNLLTADVDYVDTWKAMEKLVQSGRVRSIGLSNFNSEQTDRILSAATIKPVTNQIECHPNLNQRKLIDFCKARNITITAYSPLGGLSPLAQAQTANGQKFAISDQKVLKLAQKYKKTPAQILLRYTIQNGAIVIPKSSKKNHLEENFNIFDFDLSDADMQIMHELNDNNRIMKNDVDKDEKNYPFYIEF